MITIPQLAARALRKIGVAMVADADRPAAVATQSPADIADDMLRQLGIVVPEADRPAPTGIVPPDLIAARALQAVGVNPVAVPWSDPPAPSTAAAVASVMLVEMGIPAPPNPVTVVPVVTGTVIAAIAARAVGINPLDSTGLGSGATHTVAQVGTAALLKLAVIASDETQSTADAANALAAATSVHDILAANDYVTWGNGVIPLAAYQFYVIMTSSLLAPGYGKPASAEAFLAAQGMVRAQALSGAAGLALALEKVLRLHAELVALGIADWDSTAVPGDQVSHYVRMAAVLLAPIYRTLTAQDVAAGEQEYAAAIEAVRRNVMLRDIVARAAARVALVHAELLGLGLVTWTVDAIPAALVEAYAVLAAATMPAEGGKALDAAETAVVMARVRVYALSGNHGQDLAAAKVRAVHEQLNELALVPWTLGAVPAGAAEYYVDLAASKLWPIYRPESPEDRKGRLEADAVAMAALKRAAYVMGALARAVDRVGVVHAELNDLGLVSWPLASIPASASDCYMAMASSKMQAEGGIPLTLVEYAGWQQRVRMIAMGGAAGQALAEQKVRAAFWSLEARGRVRFTLFDVPSWGEEPLVLKAAVLLGPECFVKVDPAWDIQAERDLARIVSLPTAGGPVLADYF